MNKKMNYLQNSELSDENANSLGSEVSHIPSPQRAKKKK